MDFKIKNVEVDNSGIKPMLGFDIELRYQKYQELPFLITGVLFSEDNKILGHLIENPKHALRNTIGLPPLSQSGTTNERTTLFQKMICKVDEQTVNYIESVRQKNKKKDVTLSIKLNVKFYTTSFKVNNTIHQFNVINLIANGLVEYITIPQSEWIDRFSKKLNIGNYLLVELKEIDLDLIEEKFKNYADPNSLDNLKNKILNSVGILNKMKIYMEKGEWEIVVRLSRDFFELFKLGVNNPVEPELKRMFELRNGSTVGFENFYNSIYQMFQYISKFVHELDRSGNMQVKPQAKSEDAYFTISFCINIVNILVNKI